MKIELLSNNKNWVPKIAKWYYQEWGYQSDDKTLEHEIEKVHLCSIDHHLPLLLVAFEEDILIGVAQLRTYEMNIFPKFKYWLGGVYVSKEYRGKGIASNIILEVISKAREMKINKLYLQTEKLSGGLYTELGWTGIQKVHYDNADVLVMENNLLPK